MTPLGDCLNTNLLSPIPSYNVHVRVGQAVVAEIKGTNVRIFVNLSNLHSSSTPGFYQVYLSGIIESGIPRLASLVPFLLVSVVLRTPDCCAFNLLRPGIPSDLRSDYAYLFGI